MPSATYTLFREAILREQQVVCSYDGRRRELCPHIIGTNRHGEEVVLAWQFGGSSSLPDNSLRVLRERRLAHVLNGIRFPGFLWYAMIRTLIRIALWKMLGERTTRRVLDWGRAVLGKPPFWTRI